MKILVLAGLFTASILAHADNAPLTLQQQQACFEGFKSRGWVLTPPSGKSVSWQDIVGNPKSPNPAIDDHVFLVGRTQRDCSPYIVNLSKGTIESDWGNGWSDYLFGQLNPGERGLIAGWLSKVLETCREKPASAGRVSEALRGIWVKYLSDKTCWSDSPKRAETVIRHYSDGDRKEIDDAIADNEPPGEEERDPKARVPANAVN